MPLIFGPTFEEGKVYRSKKRTEEDDEKQALAELQTILNTKGRRICDCEAQVHELLENCLNCGRLTCESEGPGKCFYCGSLILNPEQRERLKKFIDISQAFAAPERSQARSSSSANSSASQVRIIDHQYDQAAVDNTRHLTETEKAKLKEDLDELQSKKYQRKLVLDIDIDNMQAGSSSQPLIDYSHEMRRLQVSEPAAINPSDGPSLAELIERGTAQKKHGSTSRSKPNDEPNKR